MSLLSDDDDLHLEQSDLRVSRWLDAFVEQNLDDISRLEKYPSLLRLLRYAASGRKVSRANSEKRRGHTHLAIYLRWLAHYQEIERREVIAGRPFSQSDLIEAVRLTYSAVNRPSASAIKRGLRIARENEAGYGSKKADQNACDLPLVEENAACLQPLLPSRPLSPAR